MVDKYPDKYNKCRKLASKEKDDNAKPQIQNKIDNFDSYKTE